MREEKCRGLQPEVPKAPGVGFAIKVQHWRYRALRTENCSLKRKKAPSRFVWVALKEGLRHNEVCPHE